MFDYIEEKANMESVQPRLFCTLVTMPGVGAELEREIFQDGFPKAMVTTLRSFGRTAICRRIRTTLNSQSLGTLGNVTVNGIKITDLLVHLMLP